MGEEMSRRLLEVFLKRFSFMSCLFSLFSLVGMFRRSESSSPFSIE